MREVVALLFEMIEECQREANFAYTDTERQLSLAKRDALTELRFRIRDGKRDPMWVRRRPLEAAPYHEKD